MKKTICSLGFLLLFSTVSSMAQSTYKTYKQSRPHPCFLAEYNCNGIPLVGGGVYAFGGGDTKIVPGGYFSLAVNGDVDNGKITSVIKQAPALQNGNHGSFAFAFTTTDGDRGTVSGLISVRQVCGRSCTPYAIVVTSTVSVN